MTMIGINEISMETTHLDYKEEAAHRHHYEAGKPPPRPLTAKEYKEARDLFSYYQDTSVLAGQAKYAVFRAVDAYLELKRLGPNHWNGMNESEFLIYAFKIPGSHQQRLSFQRAVVCNGYLDKRLTDDGLTMAQLEQLYLDYKEQEEEQCDDTGSVDTMASTDSLLDWEGLEETSTLTDFIEQQQQLKEEKHQRPIRWITKLLRRRCQGKKQKKKTRKSIIMRYIQQVERQKRAFEQNGRNEIYRLHEERRRYEKEHHQQEQKEEWTQDWEKRHEQAQTLFHTIDHELNSRWLEADREINDYPKFRIVPGRGIVYK